MQDGVIADFDAGERMLCYFIKKAHRRKRLVHPRIIIGVPSETTDVERRAVLDAAYRAKASEVHLVDQAMVAAIGAGLPVTEGTGSRLFTQFRAKSRTCQPAGRTLSGQSVPSIHHPSLF